MFGVYFLIMGKFNRAFTEFMLAQKSDPLSLLALFCMITVYHYWRKYNEAIVQFKKAIEINPNQGTFYFSIGQTYANIGNYNEAIAAFKKSIELTGSLAFEAWLGYTYVLSGEKEKAKHILNELLEKKKEHYVSSTCIAIIYISLKENDKIFEWLEKAYEEHDTFLLYINSLPESDSVHSDPRFKALLKKIGLPE